MWKNELIERVQDLALDTHVGFLKELNESLKGGAP